MGVIGGMDALNKLREDRAKEITRYSDLLIKAWSGKELYPFEKMELCFPVEYEYWLDVIEPLEIDRKIQVISSFINDLKSNVEIAEIRDKERPPQKCYDALKIYEIHLNSLLRTKEIGKDYLNTVSFSQTISKDTDIMEDSHFHSGDTTERLSEIFQRLYNAGYLDKKSDLCTWLFICGKEGSIKNSDSLNWTRDQQLLGYLVDTLFGDTDGQIMWSITQKVFMVKGKVPNIGSMKNFISQLTNGWIDKSKKVSALDVILKI